MTENEEEGRAASEPNRPGHEMVLGLLGVYLIFFLVFWYLLVASPFRTGPVHATTDTTTTSASVGVSPGLDMVTNQSTLGTLSTITRPRSAATVVSDWTHSASGSGP